MNDDIETKIFKVKLELIINVIRYIYYIIMTTIICFSVYSILKLLSKYSGN